MGLSLSSIREYFFPKVKKRVLMFGLRSAGKTTILYKVKRDEVLYTIPTVGFNVEDIEVKNFRFVIWDGPGTVEIRRKWHIYLENSDAVIFVVDSSDQEQMEEAAKAMSDVLLCDELKNAAVLLLANKQDVPNSMSPEKVAEKMNIMGKTHEIHVQGTCALTGSGLLEGLEHLHSMLSTKKK